MIDQPQVPDSPRAEDRKETGVSQLTMITHGTSTAVGASSPAHLERLNDAALNDGVLIRYAYSYERQSIDFPEGIGAQYLDNMQDAARDGFIIPNSPEFRFSDDETSGTRKSRKGFDRMLSCVQGKVGRGSRIYVRDASRFGRWMDPRRRFFYEILFEEAGAPIFYGGDTERIDYETDVSGRATGIFLKSTVDNIGARDERIKILERTHKGSRHTVMRGYFPANQAFYATDRWLVDTSTGQFVEKVAYRRSVRRDGCRYKLAWCSDGSVDTVRDIFRWTEQLRSLHWIAATLTSRGTPAPGNRRGPGSGSGVWHPATVRKILANPIYVGDYLYCRTVARYRGTVPAPQKEARGGDYGMILISNFIADAPVSREQWSTVQGILSGRDVARRTRVSKPKEYPLSGLLICAGCGTSYGGFTSEDRGKGHRTRYYRHPISRSSRVIDCTMGRYIRADLLEPAVSGIVDTCLVDSTLADLVSEEVARLTGQSASGDASLREIAELNKKLAQYQAAVRQASCDHTLLSSDTTGTAEEIQARAEQLESLTFAVSSHSRMVADLKRRIEAINHEAVRLEEMKRTTAALGQKIPTLKAAYAAGSAIDRKRVLGMLVQAVRVNGDTRQVEVLVRAA